MGETGSLLDTLPPDRRELLAEAPAGEDHAVRPMLAVLSDRREFPYGWVCERKLDGIRALGVRDHDRTRLLSRNGLDLHRSYPESTEALGRQRCRDFTVDGEIAAFAHGRTDFSRLQQRTQITDPEQSRASGVAVARYLFDLLRLDGHDLTRLPLRTRKSLLRGWEGLIAKRADGRYVPRRSSDWRKLKCSQGQEFVIAPGAGLRRAAAPHPAPQPRRPARTGRGVRGTPCAACTGCSTHAGAPARASWAGATTSDPRRSSGSGRRPAERRLTRCRRPP
ncbi:hypothetical protein ACH4Q6_14965 [Streptomyces lydicus]|uniref:ATP-dependent DNA ligase n=1 Tax=Streptomyces lydicus TaxID=47763 RepID=UPI00378D4653